MSHIDQDLLVFALTQAKGELSVRDVCALLCTSAATAAAAVAQNFQQQLSLCFRPKRLVDISSLLAWLPKHGSLLLSLDFNPNVTKPASTEGWGRSVRALLQDLQDSAHWCPASAEEIKTRAIGLQRSAQKFGWTEQKHSNTAELAFITTLGAADAVGSLATLRDFRSWYWSPLLQKILMHLPTGLTSLQAVWHGSSYSIPKEQEENGRHLQQAMLRLKGLRSITLKGWVGKDTPASYMQSCDRSIVPLPPNIFSHLNQLTSLELAGFWFKQEAIDHLPTSLQRLMLYAWRTPDPGFGSEWTLSDWQRDLSRLTAVTELCTGALGSPMYGRQTTQSHLVYPPNLVFLHDRCDSARDMTQLTQLRHVAGWMEPGTAVKLARVATGLTHLAVQMHKRVITGPYALQGVDQTRRVLQQVDDCAVSVVDRLEKAGVASVVRSVWLVDTREQARHTCRFDDDPDSALQGDQEPEWVMDEALVLQLARLKNLTHLKVDVCPTIEGFAALTQLSALTHLDMYNAWPQSGFGFTGVKEWVLGLPWAGLAALPDLHTLRIPCIVLLLSQEDRCPFYESLINLPQLRRLIVCYGGAKYRSGQVEDACWRAVLAKRPASMELEQYEHCGSGTEADTAEFLATVDDY